MKSRYIHVGKFYGNETLIISQVDNDKDDWDEFSF